MLGAVAAAVTAPAGDICEIYSQAYWCPLSASLLCGSHVVFALLCLVLEVSDHLLKINSPSSAEFRLLRHVVLVRSSTMSRKAGMSEN
jgi:hypothetical protein